MDSLLKPLDWVVLLGYQVLIFGIGVYFARRQTTTDEFFKASARMNWLPVALSVLASLFSGIAFIGQPARVFREDAALMAYPFSVLLITPIIVCVLLPFYRRLNVTTVYEYLEARFGLGVRLIGSLLFVGRRLAWMSLVLLAPSLALSTVTGLRVEYCVLIIGIVSTVYTALGGISAVIWTDAAQFLVLTGGQVLIIVFVAGHLDGGAMEIVRVGIADHKAWASPDFDLTRLTWWTMLIAGCALGLSDLGADQVTVQRLMATKDEKTARKALWANALFKVPSMAILLTVGVALWVFYKQCPDQLGLDSGEYDKLVPYFVVTQLPAGIAGLLISAIFAAAMSSFDSGLNCLVTTFTVDWYERLIRPGQDDRKYLVRAKVLTYVLGFTVTLLAILVYWTGFKSIVDASNKYHGFFGGGMLGILLLGTLTRRTKALPSIIAAIVSTGVIFLLDAIQVKDSYWVHPYMYLFCGCALTMVLGYLGSLFGPELPYEKVQNLTIAKKKAST